MRISPFFACQSIAGVWLGLLVLITPLSAMAQNHNSQDTQFDIYHLHAEVQGQVANEVLDISLAATAEDRDSSTLANRINAQMTWALDQLRVYPTIESQTRNYTTSPKYESNRIIGWFASQTLSLQSDDIKSVQKAVQTLQEKLQVTSMQMSPKPESRAEKEDELISEALDRFKDRALIIQLNMGASDYRIVDVQINTSHNQPYYPQMRAARESSVKSAPAVEAGSSEVTVRVDGRIQLL